MSAQTPPMRPQQVALLITGAVVYVAALASVVEGTLTASATLDELISRSYLVLGGPAFATVGIVILLNRPGHRLGRLLLLVGVGLTIASIGPIVLQLLTPFRWAIRPARGLIEFIIEYAGAISLLAGGILVMVWFPDGRATTRVGRFVELASFGFLGLAAAASASDELDGLGWVGIILAVGLYAIAIGELAWRARSAEGQARAQMLWVLGSAAVIVALTLTIPVLGESLAWIWALWIGSTILPAVAVAVAISRHHLYDIDRLVSRTISYTIVTVILVAVFGALLLVSQAALAEMTNGDTLTVAVSTLIVAALFTPLRRRVQTAVDRRFDRSAYDAARTVEAYAARLRDELDLVTLTSDLRRVTASAVHPTAADVWLRSRRSS